MSTCECPYLPEKCHTTHYGATDPATIQEYNPWCPEHGHLKEGRARATTTMTETDRSTTMTDQTVSVDKLRALLDGEGSAEDKIQAIYDDLLPDSPLPDPLFGARATHPDHGEGIITSHFPVVDGEVRFMFPDEASNDGTAFQWVSPSTLTFHTPDMSKNGAEIDTSTAHVDPIDTTPDHPVSFEAEEDYENAPEGTIVAYNENKPLVLIDELWRHIGLVGGSDHREMAGLRRRVLRWGWEA